MLIYYLVPSSFDCSSSDNSIKANGSPVCFGARDKQPGEFKVPLHGKMGGVRLVHLYGYVSCHTSDPTNWSPWGCGYGAYQEINAVITNDQNQQLLPPAEFLSAHHPQGKWHKIPGYNSTSPVIELKVFQDPLNVSAGQELRLWYAEDLTNWTVHDNGGRTCADVFILYVWDGIFQF